MLYIIAYCLIALLFTVYIIDNPHDGGDVFCSVGAGVFWPVVVVLWLGWNFLILLVMVKDYLASKLRKKQ